MPEIYRDLLRCVRCDQGGDTIKKCAKCLSVSYCGRESTTWPRHKRLCLPVMVKEMGEKGRGLVASSDFKVGDHIFKDKSVASIKRKEVPEAEVAEQIHAQITDEQTAQDRDSRAFWPSVSSLVTFV